MRNETGAVITRKGREGAILAITLILTLVLIVLSSALYIIFQTNLQSYSHARDRIKALAAAEAGAKLAMYRLAEEGEAPESGEPYSMPGDSLQWMKLPGDCGKAWVVIDPYDSNYLPNVIGGVEVRSRGLSNGVTRDVVIRISPDYPSRYALLVDNGIASGFFNDGRVIDGPVHSNGTIQFTSMTPDSTDDPFVKAVSTSMSSFYFTGAGYSAKPHPTGSNVWVRPYNHHLQGRPYWELQADSIDFSALSSWFTALAFEASQQGTCLFMPERIIIDGNRLLSKSDENSQADVISLTGKDIVFVQSGAHACYLKTIGNPDYPLTIVSTGNIYLTGNINAPLSGASGPMGIVSLGDIIIAEDPGGDDWRAPWQIETDCNIQIHASVAIPNGTLKAENCRTPSPSARVTVFGSLIQRSMGYLGYGNKGYDLSIAWNILHTSLHPPHFPSLNRWKMTSWQEDPDYDGMDIDENMF